MLVNWQVTPNPNFCPTAACGPAGTSSNPLYVTLAAPTLTWSLTSIGTHIPCPANGGGPPPCPTVASGPVVPQTLLYLATSVGGATTPATAFQNTWSKFSAGGNGSGPANVTNWSGQWQLHYYPTGSGFTSCATDVSQVLLSASGAGQCGSFAQLFLSSLAVNGTTVQILYAATLTAQAGWVQVNAADQTPTNATKMIVKNWNF